MAVKIEIRCKEHGCNQLLMNYFVTGKDVELYLSGFELKCGKCKRVFRLKNYTESSLLRNAVKGVMKI